ncbi:hypothetical protein CDEN61S_01506 [Castellaniella denitrificans]
MAFREVRDDELERVEHGHGAGRHGVQVVAQGLFQDAIVDARIGLGHPQPLAEQADGAGRVAPAAQAGQGRQAGIVPAGDVVFQDQLAQLALAGDDVAEVQAREFVLARQRRRQFAQFGQAFQDPVVEGTLVLEFERADAVRDAFQGVLDRVGPGVHGIDAPGVAGAVVGRVADAVEDRVAQVDVGRGHVDARAQGHAAVRELAGAHVAQQRQGFVGGAVAPGRVRARLGQRAAGGAHLVGRLLVHVGVAGPHQGFGEAVQGLEVVAGVIAVFRAVPRPVEAQPAHHVDDGVDVLVLFLFGIGVVEAQVADALVVARQAEVQADALGVADVQVAVGLGREAGADAGGVRRAGAPDFGRAGRERPLPVLVATGFQVVVDDGAQEIRGRR